MAVALRIRDESLLLHVRGISVSRKSFPLNFSVDCIMLMYELPTTLKAHPQPRKNHMFALITVSRKNLNNDYDHIK